MTNLVGTLFEISLLLLSYMLWLLVKKIEHFEDLLCYQMGKLEHYLQKNGGNNNGEL